MYSVLFVFEFLGTTELLVVAVVALILFGPRKLPEIGRTVGKGIAEFKRASDDFKRTWEYEVEIERRKPALDAADAGEPSPAPPEQAPAAGDEPPSALMGDEEFVGRAAQPDAPWTTVARGSADEAGENADGGRADAPTAREGYDEINAS